MTDWELIQRFAGTRDETAFETIVQRHGGIVFASARRQVGPDAAADVTQAVFLVLVRKASVLRKDVILSSWLFRTTGFVVAQWRRQEARRLRRETWVAMNSSESTPPEVHDESGQLWRRHLDDAIAALAESDRQYLLVRFFERRKFAEMAERFGVSEEAAKKRVARAIDRLRSLLSARGVALSSAVLAAKLAENRVEAVPAGVAASLVGALKQAAVGGGPGVGFGELVNAAVGSWRRELLKRWLIPAVSSAVGLSLVVVAVWTGQAWYREWGQSRRESANAVPRGEPALVAAMRERAEAARRRTQAGSKIELLVVDAATGSPIPEARVVERRNGNSEGTSFSDRTHTADAQGVCRVPVEDRQFETLNLSVSAPGRAPAELTWRSYEFNREVLTFRCELHAGTAFMGEVLNAANRPVAGASIQFVTSSAYNPGGRERFDVVLETTTDQSGRFAFEGVPAAEVRIQEGTAVPTEMECTGELFAVHPDYVRFQRKLPIREAKSGLVTIRLEPGATLRGRVMDPDGRPVSAARVKESTFESAWLGSGIRSPVLTESGAGSAREAVSDSEGHFELRHVAEPLLETQVLHIVVQADGFAPYNAALPAEYAVSDLSEDPVRAAQQYEFQGTQITPYHFDSDGAEEIQFPGSRTLKTGSHKWARKPSGDPSAPIAIEVRVRLNPLNPPSGDNLVGLAKTESGEEADSTGMVVSGRVVDQDTGVPIPAFQVYLPGDRPGFGQLIGDGVDGAFAWELGSSWNKSAALQVRASGYLPASPHHREQRPGEYRFEFRLRSSSEIWGWVELPNTRPAVGALITTVDSGTPSRWNMAGDPNIEEPESSSVRAGRDGRFRLRPNPGAKFVRILHPDGYAIRPIAAGNDTVLRLEPWASVEGQLTENHQPVAGATIRLVPGPVESAWGIHSRPSMAFEVVTKSDGAGRFRFERVPGGDLQVLSENASVSVQVRSGRSVSVVLRR